jgi:hypothetical protein
MVISLERSRICAATLLSERRRNEPSYVSAALPFWCTMTLKRSSPAPSASESAISTVMSPLPAALPSAAARNVPT